MIIKNYLRFVFRVFKKDLFYSLLNVLGLSIGISCGIILLLYLQNDLTYDRHYSSHDQIYRFSARVKADGNEYTTARSPRELAPILHEEFPEIKSFARFDGYGRFLVKHRSEDGTEKAFYE